MWHKVAPLLANDFTIVATDLRGYGDSSKPAGGPGHAAYAKRAMAQDQRDECHRQGAAGYAYFAEEIPDVVATLKSTRKVRLSPSHFSHPSHRQAFTV